MGLKYIKYTEVPPCPRCNSTRTGFYIYAPSTFVPSQAIEEAYFRRGQRARTTDIPISDLGFNVFCDDCGIEWLSKLKTYRVSRQELKDLIDEKNINISEINELYAQTEKTNILGQKKKKPLLIRGINKIFRGKRATDDDDDDEFDELDEISFNTEADLNEAIKNTTSRYKIITDKSNEKEDND